MENCDREGVGARSIALMASTRLSLRSRELCSKPEDEDSVQELKSRSSSSIERKFLTGEGYMTSFLPFFLAVYRGLLKTLAVRCVALAGVSGTIIWSWSSSGVSGQRIRPDELGLLIGLFGKSGRCSIAMTSHTFLALVLQRVYGQSLGVASWV